MPFALYPPDFKLINPSSSGWAVFRHCLSGFWCINAENLECCKGNGQCFRLNWTECPDYAQRTAGSSISHSETGVKSEKDGWMDHLVGFCSVSLSLQGQNSAEIKSGCRCCTSYFLLIKSVNNLKMTRGFEELWASVWMKLCTLKTI